MKQMASVAVKGADNNTICLLNTLLMNNPI